jgi:hypothetical protein
MHKWDAPHKWGESAHFAGAKRPQNERFKSQKGDTPGGVVTINSQGTRMTGEDLHELLLTKWGRSYDVQFRRIADQLFFQVMWKYLEQASFPLSEEEYLDHLEAIATYLTGWGSVEQVTEAIAKTKERPHVGKAVSIPLDLGGRASEWLMS